MRLWFVYRVDFLYFISLAPGHLFKVLAVSALSLEGPCWCLSARGVIFQIDRCGLQALLLRRCNFRLDTARLIFASFRRYRHGTEIYQAHELLDIADWFAHRLRGL